MNALRTRSPADDGGAACPVSSKPEIQRPEGFDLAERYFVAVHEAGHAVMSFQLGLVVQEVSIAVAGLAARLRR